MENKLLYIFCKLADHDFSVILVILLSH